jgi:hypothetical protein
MKRCPHCHFIYPDSDERCDFDKTLLVVVGDAEIDAATSPAAESSPANVAVLQTGSSINRHSRKVIPIAAAFGVTFALVLFGVYYGRSDQIAKAPVVQDSNNLPSKPVVAPQPPLPSPSPVASTSPPPAPSMAQKTSVSRTAHASNSSVSTGGTARRATQGGRPVILLSGGGKIEADEVWRTKDGVWYRRNGMVTLLKNPRVKSIVSQ